MRVEAPGGALEMDLEGPLERVLERLATLASVVPKEATWEGTTKWERRR